MKRNKTYKSYKTERQMLHRKLVEFESACRSLEIWGASEPSVYPSVKQRQRDTKLKLKRHIYTLLKLHWHGPQA